MPKENPASKPAASQPPASPSRSASQNENETPKEQPKSAFEDTMVLSLVQRFFKSAVVTFGVWLVGYFNFSFSWLLLGLVVYGWRERFTQVRDMQIEISQTAARDEKKSILARVEDLPSWVYFPDVERAEWINHILSQVWPYVGIYVQNLLTKTVEPKIKENLPAALQSFKFEKIDLGDIPPRVGGVKVYSERVKRDEIYMDIEILYSSDADVAVSIKGITAGIKDLQIRGTLRVVFKPLMNVMPLFGGLNVYFLNNPSIDFNLTSLANAFDVPGFSEMLRSIVQDQIFSIMVLPNRISVPLAENVDANRLRYPLPKGVLRIHMLGAADLKRADFGVLKKGSSDPYSVLRIGSQKFKTKTKNNTLTPVWDESFEAVIDEKSGQYMDINVFDEDPGNKDDELGNVSLDIEPVSKKGVMDAWLPLRDIESGMVHVKLVWLNLCNNPTEIDRALKQMKSESNNSENLSSCILMACVDSAKDLPKSKKSLMEPSPYVELVLGQQKEKTNIQTSTINPKWAENFRFLVHDPYFQDLTALVYDKNTSKLIGECKILLKNLLSATDMTIDQLFDMKGGDSTSTSKLRLQLVLRILSNEYKDEWQETEDLLLSEDKLPPKTEKPVGENLEDLSSHMDSSVDPVSVYESASSPLEASHLSSDLDDLATQSPSMEGLRQRKSLSPSIESAGQHGRGRIQLTLRYSCLRQKLVVVVHKCVNLLPCDDDNLADPYVRMYLLPDKSSTSKRKTEVVKNSLNPIYDLTFEFAVAPGELATRTLDIAVKHNKSMFSSDRQIIGVAFIQLHNIEDSKAVTDFFDLQPEDCVEKISIDSEN
ncbi:extended synaptotagmin-2-like isoform X3 [Octopus vulgaris]|uniref:Extended synaptotagmin-2-like isoform X3 n=1 Tax=Octopus vulgaris TaxID=6645 RepID=A0AA36FDX3_OCTVU|nr:extended synaptotagmin-2-like isoform X3 [Octopus vulgaris]